MFRNPILVFVLGITMGLALAGSVSINQIPAAQISSPFLYTFNSAGVLHEAASMEESRSPYFWLNSGGELWISGYTGSTVLGELSSSDKWKTLYAVSNAEDTDDGAHPQNLFRLLSRSKWDNVRVESQFLVLADNFSSSPNRNSSNGLLLMSRYKSGDTLYYAGVRVDGTAVIKKKYNGTYYTMAQKGVFPGVYEGNRDVKNLIPHREWISLRSETVTNSNASITVRLYLRRTGTTQWVKLIEATDSGQYGNTAPITGLGYAGIRTDFMDVRFENFRLENI